MASSDEKRTATQNRPAAPRASTPRSGSRAKANNTRTRTANGATWLIATRERASIRRSLPATRAASRHMDDPAGAQDGERGGGAGVGSEYLAARHRDDAAG